jgi:hypothetical protein
MHRIRQLRQHRSELRAVTLAGVLAWLPAQLGAQTALPDLGAGSYLGAEGGLYPGGSNLVPPMHAAAALAEAQQVVPRDASGAPAADGLIGMVCLGMSNSSQEFEDLERALDADTTRNAQLVIANTCAGGQAAEFMDEASDLYWSSIAPQRLAAAGIDPDQVQVGWLKQAYLTVAPSAFPGGAQALRDTLGNLVRVARTRYPNLRLLYLSTRIYGGYGSGNTGEPASFEGGFAAKWLIEQQINGDASLNYNAASGPVMAPLLLWGPYLWANGSTPNGAGLSWLPADFEPDHVHPSVSGEVKVGALLSAFFASAPSATWLTGRPDTRLVVLPIAADSYVDSAAPASVFGSASELQIVGGATPRRAWLKLASSEPNADLLHAKLVVRDIDTGLQPNVALASNTSWSEATLSQANAPAIDGGTLSNGSGWTRENCPSFDLTGALAADADGVLSVVIASSSTSPQRLYSREGLLPPRVILSLRNTDPIFVGGFE